MPTKTTDLCDQYEDRLQVARDALLDYGGVPTFEGPIATVQVFEDNVLVRKMLQEQGDGRVLVIDGGGSMRRALVGDIVAAMAEKNGWAGLVINGCIRDSTEIGNVPIGVKALGTNPLRPRKGGEGAVNIPVSFAGITFTPGHYLYADADGIVIAQGALDKPPSEG